MTATTPRLAVVDQPPKPAASREPTQLAKTRALARAIAKRRKALAMLAAADAEIERAFPPWAAGRSIARDEAEHHLESTGYLDRRKPYDPERGPVG